MNLDQGLEYYGPARYRPPHKLACRFMCPQRAYECMEAERDELELKARLETKKQMSYGHTRGEAERIANLKFTRASQ